GLKKGHLITAGDKEYDMLSQYPEMKASFRSFDPDSSIIKIRVEYDHAAKENRDEYERAEKIYKDDIHRLQQRFNQLSRDRSYTRDRNRIADLNRQSEQLATEKRTADNQFHEATKNIQKVRD